MRYVIVLLVIFLVSGCEMLAKNYLPDEIMTQSKAELLMKTA